MTTMKTTVVDAISETLNKLVDDGRLTREHEQLRMTNDVRNILLSGSHPVAVCDVGFGLERVWSSLLAALPVAQSQGKRVVIVMGSAISLDHVVEVVLPAMVDAYPGALSFAGYQRPRAFVCKEKLFDAIAHSDEDTDLLNSMAESLSVGEWDGRWSDWKGPTLGQSKQEALSAGQSCRGDYHDNCSYFIQSFFDVDIVATDHDTLCEALNGSSVLPSPDEAVWIIDEAHSWARSTQVAMSSAFSLDELNNLLSRMTDLPLSAEYAESIESTVASIQAFFHQHFNENQRGGCISQGFERGVLPNTLLALFSRLLNAIDALNHALSGVRGEDDVERRRIDMLSDGLYDIKDCLLAYLTPWDEQCYAKWFSYAGSTGNVHFFSQLVNVSALLYKALWSQPHGGVVVSASSLSMQDDNDHFLSAVGLNFPQSCFWRHYVSPIDFSAHGELLTPDVPFEPTSEHFNEWLKSSLFGFCEGFRSTLVLFSSFGQMRAHRAIWEATFTQHRTLIQCEGDAPSKVLVSNHKRALANGFKSVVFSTFDHAQTLDIEGDQLENVVMVKLPFPAIGTPFAASVNEVVSMQGRSPFESVVLPTVYHRLAQAMGRLLPTANQTKRCVMLDTRFTTTDFGWQLLQALPPFKRKT